MDTLLSARALMGLSLAFHTFFTPLGIGLPLLLCIAEGLGLWRKDNRYRELARAWAPVVGLLFAVGAVSGTVLSFELGLLWPRFMEEAGGIIGMPFSLEGFAFFTEAIFLAVYIYGWDRLAPTVHWLASVPLALSAALSAVFVISANAWMNAPDGFRVVDGQIVDVNPWDAMANAAWAHQALHGTLASYVVTGFAVAGAYAWLTWRRKPVLHPRLAIDVAMAMAAVAIVLQIVTGDFAARRVAELQPAKFAAMEGQYETQAGAPLRIGGIPRDGEVRYAIEIPKGLSILTYRDPDAVVVGLNEIPEEDRPNELLTHLFFQLMVGSGFAMLGIALWYWFLRWRRRLAWPLRTPLRSALIVAGFLSFFALQAGWFVTEFGRQPWVIYGYLRTADAVTAREGIDAIFILFTAIYVVVSVGLVVALLRWPHGRRGDHAPAFPGGAREAADVP